MSLMESTYFDEAKALLSPLLNDQPLLLLHLLLASPVRGYIRRFLLEQLLLRVLCGSLSTSELPYLQTEVQENQSLIVELIEVFMRSHEDVPAALLLNVNELGLRDALLASENHTVFNHVFVKNFTTEKQSALEKILLSRIEKLGSSVLSSMLTFIVNHTRSLENACRPILSLLQFIDHLQHTNKSDGTQPESPSKPFFTSETRVDVAGTIQSLCTASTAVKRAWDESVQQQSDAFFQDMIASSKSPDAFCSSVRDLRHSLYYFDVQVYRSFLDRLLKELGLTLEKAPAGGLAYLVTLASHATALFAQRVLEEEEHDSLKAFVKILQKHAVSTAGAALLSTVLPVIRSVVQDHQDIDALLKVEYNRLSNQQTDVQDASVIPLHNLISAPDSFAKQVFTSPQSLQRNTSDKNSRCENCGELDPVLASSVKRMMNQLGNNNVERVTQQLFTLLRPEDFPSFAMFFVDSYAIRHPQYLECYLQMLLSQHNDTLEECILDAAVIISKKMIADPESSVKLLKSAGSLIGAFTLERDRVLPLRKMDLARVLDDSIRQNTIKNALPFVTSVMRTCVESKVLNNPRQPWVHSILVKLISIKEDPSIPSSVKFKHVDNMLDAFDLHGDELKAMMQEAIALQPAVSASTPKTVAFASAPLQSKLSASLTSPFSPTLPTGMSPPLPSGLSASMNLSGGLPSSSLSNNLPSALPGSLSSSLSNNLPSALPGSLSSSLSNNLPSALPGSLSSALPANLSSSISGSLSSSLPPGIMPSLSQSSITSPPPGMTNNPTSPVHGTAFPSRLSMHGSGYILTPPLQPLPGQVPPVQQRPQLQEFSSEDSLAMFMEFFITSIDRCISSQQHSVILDIATNYFCQLSNNFNNARMTLISQLPRCSDRQELVNVVMDEMFSRFLPPLSHSLSAVQPPVNPSIYTNVFMSAVKQTLLRQIEGMPSPNPTILSALSDMNRPRGLQRVDSIPLSPSEEIRQHHAQAMRAISMLLSTGHSASSDTVKDICKQFQSFIKTVLSSSIPESDLEECVKILLDNMFHSFIQPAYPYPLHLLLFPLLEEFKERGTVLSTKHFKSILKRVLLCCQQRPEYRVNILFIERLLRDEYLTPQILDEVIAAELETIPIDKLEGSSVVVMLTGIIQQLMVARPRLFASQLLDTIRKVAELTATVTGASGSCPTPRLLELKSALLKLQNRYEILAQEAAYLPKFKAVLRAWMDLCDDLNPIPAEKQSVAFIMALKKRGLLQSETQTVVALRLLFMASLDMELNEPFDTAEIEAGIGSEVSVERSGVSPVQAFASLTTMMFKYFEPASKSSLLLCALSSIAFVLTEEQKAGNTRALAPALLVITQLQQTVLIPILSQLLAGTSADSSIDNPLIRAQSTDLLRVLLYGLQLLQPALLPSFSYAWTACFSSSLLIRAASLINDPIATKQFRDLLVGYVTFLTPFMTLETLPESVNTHMKALTSLLIELNSLWPDLSSSCYGDLCLLIHPRYIQLHNIICSATPAGITKFSPREAMTVQMTQCLNESTKDMWETAAMAPSLDIHDLCMSFRATGNVQIVHELLRKIGPQAPKREVLLAMLYEVAAVSYLRSYPGDKMCRKNFPLEFYTQVLKMFPGMQKMMVMSLLDHIRYPSSDTYAFCMLMKTLMGGEYKEMVFSCICERLLVPGQKSWGLEFLFSQLVNFDPEGIQKFNCYNNDPTIVELFNQYYNPK